VLINARMPLGGWALLPRGPMREPLSALRRADILIITKADQTLSVVAAMQERLKAIHPEAIIATAAHEPSGLSDDVTHEAVALERLADRKVSALSSIGDPEGFEETLRHLGASLVGTVRYPDHHRYTLDEWRTMARQAAASGAEALLTTEKDAIRLRPFWQASTPPLPVWVLRVEMRLLSGQELVDARLARVCGR
jgi:tetraacyldisaccharide 4'-kinase